MERRMRVVVAAAVVVAVVAMCGRAVEGQMAGDEVFCLDRDNQQCSIGMPMNCVTRNCELPVPYFFDMTLTGIFRPGFSCLLQDATCVNPDCAVEPCIIANQQTDWVIGFLTRDAMGNFLATNCNTICDAFNAPVTGTCNAGPISDLRNNPIQAVIATYFTPLVCAPGGGNTAAPGINVDAATGTVGSCPFSNAYQGCSATNAGGPTTGTFAPICCCGANCPIPP